MAFAWTTTGGIAPASPCELFRGLPRRPRGALGNMPNDDTKVVC